MEESIAVVRVFDPAMCCSTGVCGPSVDPQLARFSADLAWLKNQGVSVERFNLSRQPAAFAAEAAVKSVLEMQGEAGLPLVEVNGQVKSIGSYPSRGEMAAWVGVVLPAPGPDAKAARCWGPAEATTAEKSGCY